MEQLYPENLEVHLHNLNHRGNYAETYRICELIFIEWCESVEWFDDNRLWKKDCQETDIKRPSHRLIDLFSIAAYYTGNFHRAFYLQYKLLNSSFCDDKANLTRIKSNLVFSIEKISDYLIFYPEDIIERLVAGKGESNNLVTLTMTTCKRLTLFIRTMNSFLNACKDLHLIERFLVVDDNSSEEDREIMKIQYPFIELIEKTPEEKGHPISMNIIMNKVTTPYILHLEDDQQFFCRRNYIKPALRIMNENADIAQVLFNEHYGEIATDLPRITGSEIHKDKQNKKYLTHVHYPINSESYQAYFATLPIGSVTNTHWPHFSLRPSLAKTKVLREIGEFKLEREFERNFAIRYCQAGYKSAFLLGLHHLHIGRTSHDLKGDKKINNSYDLNGTRAWGY